MKKKIEAIRGTIHCDSLEVRLPAVAVRQAGWTRMEAATKAVRELGLEVEGHQRMQVIPVADGNVLVRFYDYDAAGRHTGQRSRLATI